MLNNGHNFDERNTSTNNSSTTTSSTSITSGSTTTAITSEPGVSYMTATEAKITYLVDIYKECLGVPMNSVVIRKLKEYLEDGGLSVDVVRAPLKTQRWRRGRRLAICSPSLSVAALIAFMRSTAGNGKK